jgi:flagellar protein FliL
MYYLATKYLAKANPGAAPVAAAVAPPTNPVFVSLEPFTVNLRVGGQGRFLHVGITLKVGDPKAQALIVQYLPEVRSRVLMLLSDRPSETLVSPTDKAKLAEEIQTALNKPFAPNLPSLQISSVVFTAFVLQ